MFERFVDGRARRRWVGTAVAVSIAAHAGIAAALLFSAMWHIDKLDPDLAPLVVPGTPSPVQSAAPPPPAGEERARPRRKPRPDDVVVEREVEVHPDPAGPSHAASLVSGEAFGQAGGVPGGRGGTPGSLGLGLGDDVIPERIDPCEERPASCREKEPELVPESVLEGHRTSGETWIPAPEIVRRRMIRDDLTRIRATIELCIDRSGRVSLLRPLAGSGHPEWDARLKRAMRDWRYRPYRLKSGKAVPACAPVTFLYRME